MIETVIFRCDASQVAGSGHITRCRNLARVLKENKKNIIFICREQDGDLIDLLENEFDVLRLKRNKKQNKKIVIGREHESWLGCTQEIDAKESIHEINSFGLKGIKWVVVDHYGIDKAWQTKIRKGLEASCPDLKFLVIDDLANRNHNANILLDQNFYGKSTGTRYDNLVDKECIKFLGPYYALIGPEYKELRETMTKRKGVRRVLVFLGGSDIEEITYKALHALSDKKFRGLAIDIVIGYQNRALNKIRRIANEQKNITLHRGIPSLARLMTMADLAIGAGGTTTWERACLGLPTIGIGLSSNQVPILKALGEAQHLKYIGTAKTVTIEGIRCAVTNAMEDIKNVGTGENLTDGWGAYRIYMAMFGPEKSLYLRSAKAQDEGILLEWANDPSVRKNCFSDSSIESEAHKEWFKKGLNSRDRLHMIAMMGECPVGQIRFDKGRNQIAKVSISIDRCARGHGLSKQIVSKGLQLVGRKWGNDIEIEAEVLADNKASNKCFEGLGFSKNIRIIETSKSTNLMINVWTLKTTRSCRETMNK